MNSISRTIFFVFLLLSFISRINARQPVQIIRGRIIDKATFAPLEGASVLLKEATPLKGTVTDSSGHFFFRNITAGRYSIEVSYMGYHSRSISGILLNAGKEKVLEIALNKKLNPLDEVTIIADEQAGNDPVEINYLSSRKITVEEAQRYAATFYDPVRVVTAGPGVVATNDQANHLVVRGNSPNSLLWRIEGADVVNPNHLTNAGTVSDKPSLSGGGVAILSTQLMATSKFLSSAFPAGYGNVLGGIFDIQLRDGNNQHYEFTAQTSLLGIDVAAEGPFFKNYRGSFIVNYRYSTLGLFAMAGIPIGDETINFQDLSFKISLPAGKLGVFNLFAIGGTSTTVFSGARDSTEWEFQKDRTDVDFYSDMGAAGLNHNLSLGPNSGLHSAFALSGLASGRTEHSILPDYSTDISERHKLSLIKRSFSSWYFLRLSNSNLIKAGTLINSNSFEIKTEASDSLFETLKVLHNGDADYTSIQPYLHWQYQAAAGLLFNLGIHSLYSGFNRSVSVEPRVSLKWQMNSDGYFTAGYGLHSQMQHPSVYFNSVPENENLGFTKAHHLVAGYTSRLHQHLIFRSEIYFQRLYNVPVLANRRGSFSALNLLETSIISEELANKGTGKNYGVDLSIEQLMHRGFYFLLAGSLYDSRYTGSDGVERNTRYNGNHSVKLTAGKEFEVEKKSEINVYGINISAINAGGFRFTPVINSTTIPEGETIINDENAFSEQLDDFFRMDFRLLWRKNKANYTRTFAIDIQNLTNKKNPAWPYYDFHQNKTVFKNQLGILPFLSYRIEF